MSLKLVFASDSFKGSLKSEEINQILMRVAKEVFDDVNCLPIAVSDGGEGALDCIVSVTNGVYFKNTVSDPLFRPINARYGAFEDVAVVSMSEASGLTLISNVERNPLYTTTFGTGELIKNAIEKGYKKIIITIGGSATNDGGMGALIALGAKFFLDDGSMAKGIGEELEKVRKVDFSELEKYSDVSFTVLSDVSNPLTGETGATKIFSKQKGADKNIMQRLEKGMINYETVVFNALNKPKVEIFGGGAAGGLGFALRTALNAEMRSGIDYILDLNNYDEKLIGATCVITGEGRIDEQTAYGKVIAGILARAKKANVPVFAIVGSVGEGADTLYSQGLCGIYSIIDRPDTLDGVLVDSKNLYDRTARSLFYTIKAICNN